jgi:hypothetical protein
MYPHWGRSEKVVGEGDSSSGDDEDSDSDSDRDPGPDHDCTVVKTDPSNFLNDSVESRLDESRSASACVPEAVDSRLVVVTDFKISLPNVDVIGARRFLGSALRNLFVVNLSPDYRYMKMGYYVSLHADLLGDTAVPKCLDALDVYRAPILLIRAAKAGIPVSPHIVTDSAEEAISRFDAPVMIFSVKPFPTYGFEVVRSKSALNGVMKRLTMNRRYTVCVEPLLGEVLSLESVFGTPIDLETRIICDGEIRTITERTYSEFRMPLFKCYAQREGDHVYLCGLDPLKKSRRLSATESALMNEGILRVGDELGQ